MPELQLKEFEFRGSTVRYLEGGSGFPILLMHGIGPGAAIATAFGKIIEDLVGRYHVFAMDFLGFGRSGPVPGAGRFDFALWVQQASELVERMPHGNVGIFGHSLSGAIALRLAASNPRVTHVFTTGSVGTRFSVNEHLERLWTYPASPSDLRNTLKSLLYDISDLTDAAIKERWKILSAPGYGEQFERLFVGDRQQLLNSSEIRTDELRQVRAAVTMVHGRDDLPCPPNETTLKIVEFLPQADVVLLSRCGHAPSVEHPFKIMKLLNGFFPITN